MCRKDTTQTPREDADLIWRNNPIDDSHCVDLHKLMNYVDRILSQAYTSKKNVSVDLVEYIS